MWRPRVLRRFGQHNFVIFYTVQRQLDTNRESGGRDGMEAMSFCHCSSHQGAGPTGTLQDAPPHPHLWRCCTGALPSTSTQVQDLIPELVGPLGLKVTFSPLQQ